MSRLSTTRSLFPDHLEFSERTQAGERRWLFHLTTDAMNDHYLDRRASGPCCSERSWEGLGLYTPAVKQQGLL